MGSRDLRSAIRYTEVKELLCHEYGGGRIWSGGISADLSCKSRISREHRPTDHDADGRVTRSSAKPSDGGLQAFDLLI